MATLTKQFLDHAGLSSYDTLIKNWANSANQAGYKTILKSEDGNTLNLYKKTSATLEDTPDATVALGGGDVQTQLNALASAIGATYDSDTKKYSMALDSTFSADTKTVVDALNELKNQINTLNGDDETAGSVAEAIKDAIEALDVNEFALTADNDDVISIYGIKEVDGKIEKGANKIDLAKVAKTGAAADVTTTAVEVGEDDAKKTVIPAGNVQSALQKVAEILEENAAAGEVSVVEGGESGSTLKSYTFYQGEQVEANKITKIDIPKDFLVKSGEVVVNPEGQPAGTYLKLVLNVKEGTAVEDSTIYINVGSLIEYVTGGDTAEVSVAVSDDHVVTATIVKVSASKIVYKEAAGESAEVTVKDALDTLNGEVTIEGSVKRAVKDGIDALDTTADVAVATATTDSESGAVEKITFLGSIKEENGLIAGGSADAIEIAPITTAAINALFA